MTVETIEVECYSGGRADESPRRLKIRGKTYRVARLLSETVEEAIESRGRIHRYRIITDDGMVFEVCHDDSGWHLSQTSLPRN